MTQDKLVQHMLAPVILKLASQGEVYGYNVIRLLRQKFHVYLGPSTVYPMLAKLEQSHLLYSQWLLALPKPRKVYKLTADGKSALQHAELRLREISSFFY